MIGHASLRDGAREVVENALLNEKSVGEWGLERSWVNKLGYLLVGYHKYVPAIQHEPVDCLHVLLESLKDSLALLDQAVDLAPLLLFAC